MSTQTTHHGEYGTDYKVLYLNGSQVPIYEEAKDVVKAGLGENVTEGEVVRELARAYLFLKPKTISPGMRQVVDGHASENGDPVFTLEELEAMDAQRIRNLAADANTDAVSGRSTRVEMYSYFTELEEP